MGPSFSILVLTNGGFYLLGRRQEADVASPPMDFFITDHYQNINMRLESVSGWSCRIGGITPHIWHPNLLPHISKNRHLELGKQSVKSTGVQYKESSLTVFLFNLKSTTTARIQIPLAVPILCLFDWVFTLPRFEVQTEHTPKSESISSQSRDNLVTENTQVIKVTQNLMVRENRVTVIKHLLTNIFWVSNFLGTRDFTFIELTFTWARKISHIFWTPNGRTQCNSLLLRKK